MRPRNGKTRPIVAAWGDLRAVFQTPPRFAPSRFRSLSPDGSIVGGEGWGEGAASNVAKESGVAPSPQPSPPSCAWGRGSLLVAPPAALDHMDARARPLV